MFKNSVDLNTTCTSINSCRKLQKYVKNMLLFYLEINAKNSNVPYRAGIITTLYY